MSVSAVFLLTAISCSDADTPESPAEPAYISIASASESPTFSSDATALEGEGETMSVFVMCGNAEYAYSNVKLRHDGNEWISDLQMFYAGEKYPQTLYAVYPYIDYSALFGFSVECKLATDQASQRQADLMCTAEGVELNSCSAELVMNHLLSKIVVKLKCGTEFEGGAASVGKVEVGSMSAEGSFDWKTGLWLEIGDANNTFSMSKIADDSYEVLVMPLDDCDLIPVAVTVGENRYTTQISLHGIDNKLEKGTEYTISLKVGTDKVEPDGIVAESWQLVDGGDMKAE